MTAPRVEWDARKGALNLRKHGVTFEEAETVFDDPQALFADDPLHSADESRFLVFGLSMAARVLTVVHCEREVGAAYRIISARRATRREEDYYWKGEA